MPSSIQTIWVKHCNILIVIMIFMNIIIMNFVLGKIFNNNPWIERKKKKTFFPVLFYIYFHINIISKPLSESLNLKNIPCIHMNIYHSQNEWNTMNTLRTIRIRIKHNSRNFSPKKEMYKFPVTSSILSYIHPWWWSFDLMG